MDILKSRRILAVGGPDSGILTLLQGTISLLCISKMAHLIDFPNSILDLTGSNPTPHDNSTAGLSHIWTLRTRYYTATIPIWLDEIQSVPAWRAEFLKAEAAEVVEAVGGWVFCFRKPVMVEGMGVVRDTLAAIQKVIATACDGAWDGVCVAVAMPQSLTPSLTRTAEEWDELCAEFGFEFVDAEARGKNEFGEKVGLERVREALAANDWAAEEEVVEAAVDSDEYEQSAAEEAELRVEWLGMKSVINGAEDEDEDEEGQVEEIECMMMRLQAVKGMLSSSDDTHGDLLLSQP